MNDAATGKGVGEGRGIFSWPWLLGGWGLLVTVAIYVAAVSIMPREQLPYFHSESGPVEWVTALFFVAMGPLGVALAWRGRRRGGPGDAGLPTYVLVWYVLVAGAGVFVAMEELSYGQHLLGWESPEFFEEHNKQAETNLHNLFGDAGSSTVRKVGNVSMPVFCIVLPLIFMRRPESYRPGHFSYYLLPRWELVGWVVVAMLLSPIRKLGGFTGEGPWEGSLSEYKELLWGATGVVYLVVMWLRLFVENRALGEATDGEREAGTGS